MQQSQSFRFGSSSCKSYSGEEYVQLQERCTGELIAMDCSRYRRETASQSHEFCPDAADAAREAKDKCNVSEAERNRHARGAKQGQPPTPPQV